MSLKAKIKPLDSGKDDPSDYCMNCINSYKQLDALPRNPATKYRRHRPLDGVYDLFLKHCVSHFLHSNNRTHQRILVPLDKESLDIRKALRFYLQNSFWSPQPIVHNPCQCPAVGQIELYSCSALRFSHFGHRNMDTPIDKRDFNDPGDEVLRKFRYQHAYGVVLLIGIATNRLTYTAIWCEQHEDFLAQYNNGEFDVYQIKTRKSELGPWELNDESFSKSVGRFISLNSTFPGKIRSFYFVSNTVCSESNAFGKKHFSPVALQDAVRSASQWQDIAGEARKGFDWLKDKLNTTEDALFAVLKRIKLILGPTERAYEDELCQSHISTLDECSSMSASTLKKVMEAMIAMLAQAASIVSSDPSRHWLDRVIDGKLDPFLLSKRLTRENLILVIRDLREPSFNYLPSLATLELGAADGKMDTLKKKLVKGGLADRYETFRRRSLSAEQVLLDFATRPNEDDKKCSQIENVVLAECDEAHFRASQKTSPFGPAMLIDVQDRLRHVAEANPAKVFKQPYDLLIGVAGLLTSECKVWWSEQFSLEEIK